MNWHAMQQGDGSFWSRNFQFFCFTITTSRCTFAFPSLLQVSNCIVFRLMRPGAVCYSEPTFIFICVLLHVMICCMAVIYWLDGDAFIPDMHAYFRNSACWWPFGFLMSFVWVSAGCVTNRGSVRGGHARACVGVVGDGAGVWP